MNEKQGDFGETDGTATASAEAGGEPAEAPEQQSPASDQHGQKPARPAKPRSRRSGGLALLMSLLALGLAGWLFYTQYFVSQVALDTRSDSAFAQELAALGARVDDLNTRLGAVVAESEEQQQRLVERDDARSQQLNRLAAQIEGLESSAQAQFERRLDQLDDDLARQARLWSEELSALEEQLGGAVDAWQVRGDEERQVERDLLRHVAMLEAAALLRIGQQRAELGGDLRGAGLAYRRSQQLLDQLDDVRLDRVKRLIAQELESMENLPGVDFASALARLDRLSRDSRQWPFLIGQVGVDATARAEGAEPEHWRDRLSGAARGLVRVQARDELGRTEEQFQAARDLLQLRLVAAQLALSRRDEAAFALQLSAATDLLDEWFDRSSDAVAQARQELVELGDLNFEPELPELGAALNRLQTLLGGS